MRSRPLSSFDNFVGALDQVFGPQLEIFPYPFCHCLLQYGVEHGTLAGEATAF
jgi:hypothetical protein